MTSDGKVDVVVVGGGLAGLSAATALVERGARVAVLEARDRVGGRTYSTSIDGHVFDLGAQWIGPHQRRMLDLAAAQGVTLFPTKKPGRNVMEREGRVTTHEGTIPDMPLFNLLDLHLGLGRVERAVRTANTAAPERTPRAEWLDARSVESAASRFLWTKGARGPFDAAFRTIFGAEPAEVSLLHFLYYLRQGGGFERIIETEDGAQQDRVQGGTQQFSIRLAAALGDAVHLSTPVRIIEQTAHGVCVHGDTRAWEAHRAIVAVPLHLASRIAYEPMLPTMRDRLTQAMPMGSTIKAFALYERPFWRDRGLSGEAVMCSGPLAVAFDNSLPDDKPACLLGFLVGKHARHWSARPPEERRAAVLAAFARLYGEEATRPLTYRDHDWSGDPWAGGCPTGAFPAGCFLPYAPALRAPCGRIHWAGTETAQEWTGYMEGAVESGRRAADEVSAALGS